MIQIQKTNIPDCIVVNNAPFVDERGVFCEIFKESSLSFFKPLQCNYSFSKKNVLRGIHRTPYAKLVTCLSGTVFDVCVDLRIGSKTHNQYYGVELSENNNKSIYIPPYCGHSFLALQDSIVVYLQDQEYDSKLDETYCYKNFNIPWPKNPDIISLKDQNSCK